MKYLRKLNLSGYNFLLSTNANNIYDIMIIENEINR